MNFEEGIEKAWELGVRRFVTEFWYTGNEAWRDDLVFANKKMTAILDKQEA